MPMGTYRLVVSFYLVVCFEACARQDTSNMTPPSALASDKLEWLGNWKFGMRLSDSFGTDLKTSHRDLEPT